MRPHIGITILCAALGMTTLTGCTTDQPGQAIPGDTPTVSTRPSSTPESPTTTSNNPAELPSDGAPKVQNPIQTTKFEQDPCLVFTQTQTAKLDVRSPGTPGPSPLGKACIWRNDDRGRVEIVWATGVSRGLSAVYKANKAGKFLYFEVLPSIEGLPAVAYDVVDLRPEGHCGVTVGVTDKLTFSVLLAQSQSKVGTADPCSVAALVAAEAVKTMKAGG
ncbi:DUF3558 domain-containing protein [Actinokineospora sp.]|uniref:DUF3558 domain-containing protein n=1 Tax=Actinokineospora sp. TaxID=1872133 RepID=UPI004037B274